MRRPLLLWPLIFVLVFLALGGFSGGVPMLMDPQNGGYLQFAEMLPLLPVPDLVLPGLFLLTVMGLFPLLLAFALVVRPQWGLFERLFSWSRYYWAWTASMLLVLIIAVWLIYEGSLVGWFPITYITALLGVLILLFSMLPPVRRFYERKD